jgi:tetratricopeptide (TPR) repeat protein
MARWLERSPDALDERIGHHLGEAYRLLADLGPLGDDEHALAAEAADRLDAAAGAALLRGDPPAAARLLERAEALMGPDARARADLLPRLGAALLEAGRLADADRVLAEAIELAGDDALLESRARVERQLVRLQAGSETQPGESERIADSALAVFEARGDELGQCRALGLRARQALIEGRLAKADDAWRRAAEHALRLGDEAALFEILDWRGAAALFGPTPVAQAIALCRQIHDQLSENPVAAARIFRPLAVLEAMAGNRDEARRLLGAGDDILGEVGGLQSAITQQEALVELLAGQPSEAEARLRRGYEALEAMGEKALLATTAAMLAQTLYIQQRYDEAADACAVSQELTADDDVSAKVGWRSVRAKLLARAGHSADALALASEAVELAERTDFLTIRAEAQLDLAEVLEAGGRPEEAHAARHAALDLYREKGDVVSAERVGAALA